jgi:hypothetical protein
MCKSCEALMINGILCHEYGCPDAWKDEKHICKECGQEFIPEENWQQFCSSHCYCMYNNLECDCDICLEFDAELEEENENE